MRRFALLSLIVIGAVGCDSGGPPPLTKEEQAKFKGGPMPAGTWNKMAASRTSWEDQHGLKATGGKPNPNESAPSTKAQPPSGSK